MSTTKEKMYLKDEVATKIFTSEKCFDYTASVIAATLGMDAKYVRKHLKLISPKISGNIENKGTTVDAIYSHDEFFTNIEVNYNYYEDGLIKNTLYIAQLLLRQTHPGDKYLKTLPIKQININHYDHFKKGEFVYKSYLMEEKYHLRRTKLIEIYDINVDYLNKYEYNEIKGLKNDDLRYLLYIFVCSDGYERDRLYKENPLMSEVFHEMEKITEEFDGILYYNRKEFLENAAYNQGEKDGFQDGFHKGKSEGFRDGKLEGEKKKQIEIARKMLNKDKKIEEIMEFTDLTKKEIENIQKKMKN